jgi:hypothetical protein
MVALEAFGARKHSIVVDELVGFGVFWYSVFSELPWLSTPY